MLNEIWNTRFHFNVSILFYYQDDSDLARWMDFKNTREDNLENHNPLNWMDFILINVNTHLTFFLL